MKTVALLILFTFLSCTTMADTAIIVNHANQNILDENQVRNIFLGRSKVFPNGKKVTAFNLSKGNKSRDNFNHKLLHKSESNLNSYWARMIFSSRAKPPMDVADDQTMIYNISNNKNGIGYIDANMINDQIKVILTIKD